MQFADRSFLEKWECELQDIDAAKAGRRFVEIEGLDDNDYVGIQSGVNTLFVNGAMLSNGKLIVPRGVQRNIGTIEPRGPAARTRREQQNNGVGAYNQQSNGVGSKAKRGLAPLIVEERVVLAVRVDAVDSSTNATATTISDKVFGTSGDVINLSERYQTCSYGEIRVEPFVGVTTTNKVIENGVYEVTISTSVLGVKNAIVKDQVLAVLGQELGDLPSQFDHVMLCLPPGTADGWIAWSKSSIEIRIAPLFLTHTSGSCCCCCTRSLGRLAFCV